MAVKLKPLSEQVIVITGASSGIGLATAQLAAERGAKVVLCARSRDALAQAVDRIKQAGGEAAFAVADVGKREELEAVAAEAIDRFGRIDTWVNNAGVGIWGRIEEVAEADMRRLFETNFWGVVYGSEIALKHLKADGGALITVGSVVSDRAFPIQGIYSASKHAVKGFTDALRMELEEEGAPVSVTLIKPGSIGTPMPQHVKNYSEQEAKFPPPIYAPEEVAKSILHAAEHPVRDLFVGSAAKTGSAAGYRTPRLLDWISETFLVKAQFGPEPATPTDNLHSGQSEGQVRGDHQGSLIRPSAYSKATRHPGAAAAVAGLAAAGVGAFVWSRRGWKEVPEKRVERRDGEPEVTFVDDGVQGY